MKKKSRKVLVTGGAGYIGSHTIIELLNAGYDVVSVDNFSNSSSKVFKNIFKITGKNVKNYNVDLSDVKKVKKIFSGKKFDAIIHFAAYKAVGESVDKPLKYYKNNIGSLIGALDIVKSCKTSNFVFSSSAAIYDPNEKVPYTEVSKPNPSSPYGDTKKIGEDILKNFTLNSKGFSSLSLRYFNPGGAHSSLLIGEDPKGMPANLVPMITRATRTKKPFSVFGADYDTSDGTGIRDYVHVVDVARAHVLALHYLESKKEKYYEVFNIGTGKGTSVMEMIHAFEKINNLRPPYVIKKRRHGDMPIVFASTKKAEKYLGFKAKYSIVDIMKTAWGWEIKNNKG